jgi:apolipoprotein D and lipocalin family protein
MHRMIPAVLCLSALFLTACVGGKREIATYRQPEAPIWSAAAFAPAQVTGRWQQVAAFAAEPGSCRGGAVSVDPAPGGFAVKGTLCLDGEARKVDALARPVGPGRLSVEGQEDWWVLWVDSGYRTLAVGTPSGRFGFVLDRGQIPKDRLAAAAEIFAFNGYTSGRLQPF